MKRGIEMIVNHGGSLSKGYFKSYLHLIRQSRASSIEEAKQIALEIFFKNNPYKYGQKTYQQFLKAYQEMVLNE
jgi:hypothetical protein